MNAPQSCTIVPYAAEYLEDVGLIDRQCFIDPWLKRSFIEELNAPCAYNYVAVSPGAASTIMGYCLARIIADECTINRLAIHPDFQRSGIATNLLTTILNRAGRTGACKCFIEVRESNSAALCFYERHGFSQIGTRSSYYQIGHEDAILMSRATGTENPGKSSTQE